MSDTAETTAEATDGLWCGLTAEERENVIEIAKTVSVHEFIESNPDIDDRVITYLYPNSDTYRPGELP
jgi:hypothetical protein